jgi:hypothetical protein
MLTSPTLTPAYFARAVATVSVGLVLPVDRDRLTSELRRRERAVHAVLRRLHRLRRGEGEGAATGIGGLDLDVGRADAAVRRERVADLLDRVGDDVFLHVDALPVPAAQDADLRVGEPQPPQRVAHVGDVSGMPARHPHLPRGAALEVDTEVEPAREQRDEAQQDQHAGENRPAFAVLDELEVGALVVEVGGPVATSDARNILDRLPER